MLEVSKGSKSLKMKINELITTLEEKHIKEAGGFDVESDTIAKLQKNFPSWKLGMPHPESNEPTMTKQELIKFYGAEKIDKVLNQVKVLPYTISNKKQKNALL